jgi:hypothetical protein
VSETPSVTGLENIVARRIAEAYIAGGVFRTYSMLYYLRELAALKRKVNEVIATTMDTDALLRQLRVRSIWTPIIPSPITDLLVGIGVRDRVPVVSGFSCTVAGSLRSLPVLRTDMCLTAYGTQIKEIVVERGRDPSKFVQLTGAAYLSDVYKNAGSMLKAQFVEEHPAVGGQPIIAVMTSRDDADGEDLWLKPLIEWVERNNRCLVIKPHPNPTRERSYAPLKDWIEERKFTRTIWSRQPAHEMLHVADVIITDVSSIGVEAISQNKILVQVNTTGEPYPFNRYADDGVAFGACSASEVIEVIDRWLRNPVLPDYMVAAKDRFLARYHCSADNRAADRIAALLESPLHVPSTLDQPFVEYVTLDIGYYRTLAQDTFVDASRIPGLACAHDGSEDPLPICDIRVSLPPPLGAASVVDVAAKSMRSEPSRPDRRAGP